MMEKAPKSSILNPKPPILGLVASRMGVQVGIWSLGLRDQEGLAFDLRFRDVMRPTKLPIPVNP